MDRSYTQIDGKENLGLHYTLNQRELTDVYRTFHPKVEYIFFSSTHGILSRKDHIIGHKTNFSKFKNIKKNIPRTFLIIII